MVLCLFKMYVLLNEIFISTRQSIASWRPQMKALKVIKHPHAFELLADETRRRIIYLLRAKERTVSQIAEEMDLTPQAIYHHIRKLRDADMVEVGREERVDHFIETYYRATAEVFSLSHGEAPSQKQLEGQARDALEGLAKLGFHVAKDEATARKIVDPDRKLEECGEKDEWMDKITEIEDIDFFTRQHLSHYVKMIAMTDEEFARV